MDIADYTYDALGRRIEVINYKDPVTYGSATTKRYYYDGQRVVLEQDNDGGWDDRATYVFGNYIDEVLFANYSQYNIDCYFHHDHLYSPVVLVFDDGSIPRRYEYDAYGDPNIYNDSYSTEFDYPLFGYLFTGRRVDYLDYYDDEVHLKIQYNRNRSYDYTTGRWLQRDPIGYVSG